MTLNYLIARFQVLELWGNMNYLFIAIAHNSLWPGMIASDRFLSKGPIELFDN